MSGILFFIFASCHPLMNHVPILSQEAVERSDITLIVSIRIILLFYILPLSYSYGKLIDIKNVSNNVYITILTFHNLINLHEMKELKQNCYTTSITFNKTNDNNHEASDS